MKRIIKIIKNKVFVVAILCIVSCGIGIYAANTYQANTISYTPSDGSEGINDVNAALNDLYEKSKTECEKDSFCSKVKIGDYIKMTPTETTYTILSSLTGYTSDQTINPSELNIWRVIKKNDDGTIEMVSENVSSTNIYFQGQTGYLNFVGVLNLIASQYGNSKYTIDSRIIGYNGQTATITDTSKFTTTAPWTSSTSNNSNEVLGGGDIMYEADTNLVKEVLGTLKATNPSGTATGYWLGSRIYYYSRSTDYDWNGRSVFSNGFIYYNYLYLYNSGWRSYTSSNAIRPILTLKSGLAASGSGTSEDPWVLQ